MLIYLIALADALFYLGAMPVRAAFCADFEGALRFGAGLAVFDTSAALRRARRSQRHKKTEKPRKPPNPARLWPSLRVLRVERFALTGSVCLGDAAVTALACGALRALAATLGLRAREVRIDLVPQFDGGEPRIALTGMIRASAGQIIVAAARGELTYAKERIAQWKDTRLKALWPPPWKTSAT